MNLHEVDVEGRIVENGIVLLGTARRQPDGTWRCLANVNGALCLVQVRVRWDPKLFVGEARRVEDER